APSSRAASTALRPSGTPNAGGSPTRSGPKSAPPIPARPNTPRKQAQPLRLQSELTAERSGRKKNPPARESRGSGGGPDGRVLSSGVSPTERKQSKMRVNS